MYRNVKIQGFERTERGGKKWAESEPEGRRRGDRRKRNAVGGKQCSGVIKVCPYL